MDESWAGQIIHEMFFYFAESWEILNFLFSSLPSILFFHLIVLLPMHAHLQIIEPTI